MQKGIRNIFLSVKSKWSHSFGSPMYTYIHTFMDTSTYQIPSITIADK